MKVFQWLIVFGLLTMALGCGVTTHNVIAHRAMNWFTDSDHPEFIAILKNNQRAFQNGVAFPDWGYDCWLKSIYPNLPDASESSHWNPFHVAAAEYIYQTYPQPWDKSTEALIAFLMGVVSHGIADILWHDLAYVSKTHQGFIQAQADMDYFGSYSDSHSEADTGGEFMAAYEVDLSFLDLEWHLPSQDLANIFHNLNYSWVTPTIIEGCVAELWAEVQAIKNLPSELLYPYFSKSSPFLVEQYQDWWLGGLNDMATWTSMCWPQVISWVYTGKVGAPCLVNSKRSASVPILQKIKSRQHMRDTLQNLGIVKEKPVLEQVDRGVIFKMNQTVPRIAQDLKAPALSLGAGSCLSQKSGDSIEFFTRNAESLLGSSFAVADFNKDGHDDLAIGSPAYSNPGTAQKGAIFVVHGLNTEHGHIDLEIETVSQTQIFGESTNLRLGYALTSLDFNLDGYPDLIASAPGAGAEKLIYSGKIFVYFGSSKGISTTPDVTIAETHMGTNLGYSLKIGDINGDSHPDLIIGNPMASGPSGTEAGSVWIFLSSTKMKSGITLTKSDAAWIHSGDDDYDWFGFDLYFIAPLLLIGAPGYAIQNNITQGKLLAYDFSQFNSSSHQVKRVWTIEGVDTWGKLGSSLAVGSPFADGNQYIALSLPSKTIPGSFVDFIQGGSVVLFPFQALQGNLTINQLKIVTTFEGAEGFSRLGWKVGFSRNSKGPDTFWITEPWKDADVLPSAADSGIVYFYNGGNGFPTGQVSDPQSSADLCILSDSHKSLYGKSGAITLDFNGDGKLDFLFAGPRDHTFSPNAGSVSLMLSLFDS